MKEKVRSELNEYFPVHRVSSKNSKFEILKQLLPTEFLLGVMERRRQDRVGGLSFSKGVNRHVTVKMSESVLWNMIAVKIHVYSRKFSMGGIDERVNRIVKELKRINKDVYGGYLMRKLMDMFYLEVNSIDEYQILEFMGNMFLKFGDYVSGDEKLFRYTGASGFVRMVINKPARLGLWMFQAAVRLKCGLPCIVYSRMHSSCMNTKKRISCHDIVKYWGNLILDRGQNRETVLVMDNYYLTEESRLWLRRHRIKYIASISRVRFGSIVNSMERRLVKSGTHISAYNKKTNESVTYCWASDNRIGKKVVLANGFEVCIKKSEDAVIPLFDHYNVAFSGCDKFNWTMHGKSWPMKRRGDFRVGSDYWFTLILIDCYHSWIDSGLLSDERDKVSWFKFCVQLSEEIVKETKVKSTDV